MTNSLNEILIQISELLSECGWESKAKWFDDRRVKVFSSKTSSAESKASIQELFKSIGGIGGFTDIPLTPRSGQMTAQQARDKQWELAEALGEAIENSWRN
jgi:hypothetical protein